MDAKSTSGSLLSRHAAIGSARSVDELVALVPPGWAEYLGPDLRDVARLAALLAGKRKHAQELQALAAAGSFPSFIPRKKPTIQVSKEVRDSAEGRAAIEKLQSVVDTQRRELRDEAIAIATLEVAALEGQLDDKLVYNRLLASLTKAAPAVKEKRKYVVTNTGQDGQTHFEFKLSPAFDTEYSSLAADLLPLALQARLIAESKARAAAEKEKKKKEVKSNADSMDVDNDTEGGAAGSLQKLVERVVDKKVKKLKKVHDVSTIPSSSQIYTELFDAIVQESRYPCLTPFGAEEGEIRQEGWCEEEVGPSQRQTHRQGRVVGQSQGQSGQGESGQGSEGWERKRKSKGEVIAYNVEFLSRRDLMSLLSCNNKFCVCALGCESSLSYKIGLKWRVLCELHFRWNKPETYPDWFLEIGPDEAAEEVVTRTPLDVLEASRYRGHVHLSTGVSMPMKLQIQLSTGLKYLLAPHPLAHFKLGGAYADFCNRIRWRIKYLFESADNVESDYDPDYEYEHDTPECSFKLTYVEDGLLAGQRLVSDTISRYTRVLNESGYDTTASLRETVVRQSVAPRFKSLQQFLKDNNYIVTGTDKNLGTAVSERKWYNTQCEKLLSDKEAYLEITMLEVTTILNQQRERMFALANAATMLEGVWPGGAQLPGFFRSNIPEAGEKFHVPNFHGIPKIHKKPTGMRPIIPCHSAIQNPAAKFVDKILGPIIKSEDTILQSSRQFCRELSNLRLQPEQKIFLVSGDVVAYYPNIPLQSALDITWHLARAWYKNNRDIPEDHPVWEVFHRALLVGNEDLILRFNSKYYKQIKGLAMGVADSPSIANLYGAWFEVAQGQILEKPEIIYYRRYIDDVFCIIAAPSEQEALHFVQNTVSFVGCRITWEVSFTSCPFLDVWVFLDPREPSRVQYKPYRKAHNHRERIPWISHHPFDVKKGTFLGEMSRLAPLCSKLEYYRDAMYDLQGLYCARGYPPGLISDWLKDNMSSRWEKRYAIPDAQSETGDKATFAVVKSEFNPVLNYFNAKELGDTIISTWRKSMEMWTSGNLPECYTKDWSIGKTLLSEDMALCQNIPELVTSVKGGQHTEGVSNKVSLPDVTKLNSLMRAKWLVSRKRTRNLFDLTNLWKRKVLASMDQNLFDDLNVYSPTFDREEVVFPDDIVSTSLGKRPVLADSEMPATKKIRTSESDTLARVPYAWGRSNADVVIGPSAPRGLITHFVRKDIKGKGKAT